MDGIGGGLAALAFWGFVAAVVDIVEERCVASPHIARREDEQVAGLQPGRVGGAA